MRLNGHNDQCTCAECGSTSQLAIGIELNELSRDFPLTPPTAGERAGDPGEPAPLPPLVKARASWELPPEVRHALVIGAIELDHGPETGRIVALKLQVLDRDRGTEWAIWWDRERNTLVARPLRVEQG